MVDDSLPFQANIVLAQLFKLIGVLLITIFSLPLLIPLTVILFIFYYFIQVKLFKNEENRNFSVIIDIQLVRLKEYHH